MLLHAQLAKTQAALHAAATDACKSLMIGLSRACGFVAMLGTRIEDDEHMRFNADALNTSQYQNLQKSQLQMPEQD